MYQPAKSEPSQALRAMIATGKVLGMAAAIVTGAIIVVPVAAGAMVKWAAGALYDAMRPERARE